MEYVKLGRSGLRVSRLILGTTNFGVDTEEADAHRILDAALERGINTIDTADAYGYHKGKGRTEEFIGRWIEKNRTKRGSCVLATKLFTGPTATD